MQLWAPVAQCRHHRQVNACQRGPVTEAIHIGLLTITSSGFHKPAGCHAGLLGNASIRRRFADRPTIMARRPNPGALEPHSVRSGPLKAKPASRKTGQWGDPTGEFGRKAGCVALSHRRHGVSVRSGLRVMQGTPSPQSQGGFLIKQARARHDRNGAMVKWSAGGCGLPRYRFAPANLGPGRPDPLRASPLCPRQLARQSWHGSRSRGRPRR